MHENSQLRESVFDNGCIISDKLRTCFIIFFYILPVFMGLCRGLKDRIRESIDHY